MPTTGEDPLRKYWAISIQRSKIELLIGPGACCSKCAFRICWDPNGMNPSYGSSNLSDRTKKSSLPSTVMRTLESPYCATSARRRRWRIESGSEVYGIRPHLCHLRQPTDAFSRREAVAEAASQELYSRLVDNVALAWPYGPSRRLRRRSQGRARDLLAVTGHPADPYTTLTDKRKLRCGGRELCTQPMEIESSSSRPRSAPLGEAAKSWRCWEDLPASTTGCSGRMDARLSSSPAQTPRWFHLHHPLE
jgi:hypothetical protein